MRKTYPSDISREQFETILPLLEAARRKTKKRKLDLYDVFCGVLYVLKGGIQWRMLPESYPNWRSVYAYSQIWSEEKDGQESILEQRLKKLVGEARTRSGRSEKSSLCITDAQSVKNTDTAKQHVANIQQDTFEATKKAFGDFVASRPFRYLFSSF